MTHSLLEQSQMVNSTKIGTTESVVKAMVARAANGVVNMPPGIARRILDELNFTGQRAIDETRIYGKLRDIIKGDWQEGHPITLVVFDDGTMWLVDGQHRLTAISRCDSPVPVTVRIVPMESEKEARQFYAGFDQKTSVRTTAQLLDAIDLAAQVKLSRRMTQAVFGAAPLLLNNLEPMTGSASVKGNPEIFATSSRNDAVRHWASEARQYESIAGLAKAALRTKLMMPGTLAVALFTLRHQPAKAVDFWTGLADNDGLRKNDPRSTLLQDILTRGLNTGAIRQRVQQPSLAWNAWCEGRDLKIIKCITDAPITLWGTPLAKGGK